MGKINLVEILKDCPKGMELNCAMYEDVYFDYVDKLNIIHCYIQQETHKTSITFNQHGTPNSDSDIKSKCVIFPKGKTTWEGFQRPFKDGDVVFYNDTIAIFKEWGDETLFKTYVTKYLCCDSLIDTNVPLFGKGVRKEIRFATEEEKQKLFNAIKDNGYRWNAETKTLEKLIEPKFKVGDKIRDKTTNKIFIITHKDNLSYYVDSKHFAIWIENQDNYELVPNKFDITTLKPFDMVLVRDSNTLSWTNSFYSNYNIKDNFPFYCINLGKFKQCIPYKGNEHLLNTTDDCDDYYKTW